MCNVEYFLNKSFQHHTGNAINGLPICYNNHREEREEVLIKTTTGGNV